jgi:hypothetical protein
MPFAGDAAAARAAVDVLAALHVGPGDELILADNCGAAPSAASVIVVAAPGERSPAHARNVGAEHARNDWILFLDADCRAPGGLLDSYFERPIKPDVGALAGEIAAARNPATLAARYGAARNFLSPQAHLAHPYRPRAVAANLLVRRAAFDQVGGFYEGVRAAEDTDFSWRLQAAQWRLELAPAARIEHRYRATVSELRQQWRGYAAGRAWLSRRVAGFAPEPAIVRAGARLWAAGPGRSRHQRRRARDRAPLCAGALVRGSYLALDAVLAVDELVGLLLSNRPRTGAGGSAVRPPGPARGVVIVDRFPACGDPLADLVRQRPDLRVEAVARPDVVDRAVARSLRIAYREDDGVAARAVAVARLVTRHPVRCALDRVRRRPGEPALAALAPAVLRLQRDTSAQVHVLAGSDEQRTAWRLATLSGRTLQRSA